LHIVITEARKSLDLQKKDEEFRKYANSHFAHFDEAIRHWEKRRFHRFHDPEV